jgi:DNA adenine methylase
MSEAPTSSPVIGALAPWFGGKRTLAPRIVRELGPHRAYWEPFLGGCAILPVKPPCPMETVNDLHGDMVNLARVVQHDELAPRLFDRLLRTLPGEDMLHDAAARHAQRGRAQAPDAPDLDRAADFFVACWLGRNGVAGTHSYNQGFCVRYTASGGSPAKRFRSAIESIPAWWERLRNVTILNRDAFDLLDRIEDASGVVIYADPPYIEKGASYVHDFETEDEPEEASLWGDRKPRRVNHHRLLAESVRRFTRTRVVVSYYNHPLLDELYPGWTKVHCPTTKAMVNQGMRDRQGATQAPEVLLINGPNFTAKAEVAC